MRTRRTGWRASWSATCRLLLSAGSSEPVPRRSPPSSRKTGNPRDERVQEHGDSGMTPTTMRAVVLRASGGPEQLVYGRVRTPVPGRGEALVRVHAAALTRGELEWAVDRLPAIPSYELSGVVAALGPGADDLVVGDEVFGMTAFDRDGVAADYAALPSELLAPKPRALGHPEAAAAPLAALSAWQGLFDHGGLVAGERVLIHGAT